MIDRIIQTFWIASTPLDPLVSEINDGGGRHHSLGGLPEPHLAPLPDLIGALRIRILGFSKARLLSAG